MPVTSLAYCYCHSASFGTVYARIEPVSGEGLVRPADTVLSGFVSSNIVLSVSADSAGSVGKAG